VYVAVESLSRVMSHEAQHEACTSFRLPMAVATALTVAAVSSRAQAPGVYGLHEVPEGATLHKVTAAPAEYKGRKALKV